MYRYKYKYKYESDLIRTKQTSTPLTIRITNKGGNYSFAFLVAYMVGGDSKEQKGELSPGKQETITVPAGTTGIIQLVIAATSTPSCVSSYAIDTNAIDTNKMTHFCYEVTTEGSIVEFMQVVC
jgi:hypothetical protein